MATLLIFSGICIIIASYLLVKEHHEEYPNEDHLEPPRGGG